MSASSERLLNTHPAQPLSEDMLPANVKAVLDQSQQAVPLGRSFYDTQVAKDLSMLGDGVQTRRLPAGSNTPKLPAA